MVVAPDDCLKQIDPLVLEILLECFSCTRDFKDIIAIYNSHQKIKRMIVSLFQSDRLKLDR